MQANIDPLFTVVAKSIHSWQPLQQEISSLDAVGNVSDSDTASQLEQDTDTAQRSEEVQKEMSTAGVSSDASGRETLSGSTGMESAKTDSFPSGGKKAKLDCTESHSTALDAVNDRKKRKKKKQALRLVEDICR